jgi:hypothetical protein
LSMSVNAGHKDVKDSKCFEVVPDMLRAILEEHSLKLERQNALQYNEFLESLNSKISQQVQVQFSELKESLLGDITVNTKALVSEAMSEVSQKLTVTVREEVSKLDVKVSAQFNAFSDAWSKSGSSGSNSQLSLKSFSSGSCASGTQNVENVDSGRVQKWPCPFCPAILKHEHSFYDHMTTLMSRIHELPVHSAGPNESNAKSVYLILPTLTIVLFCVRGIVREYLIGIRFLHS